MAEVSPLYVLLTVMRDKWKDREIEGAVALAKVAAPYMHGRAATAPAAAGLSEMSDDELDEGGEAGGEDAAAEGPG